MDATTNFNSGINLEPLADLLLAAIQAQQQGINI